jgi:RNA polymerase sigma-70 factor, ECF subfamily
VLVQLDSGVVRRAQAGDERAFSLIVNAHQAPIFYYILRSVGDRELAEDLTQEVFLRAWRSLPSYAFRSQLTTWLYRIATNIILDDRRSRKNRQPILELVPALTPAMLDPPVEQSETIDAIWLAIGQLRPSLRTPLLLRDIAGLSYREISDTLEISLADVKWRIYKAREGVQLAVAGGASMVGVAGEAGA